MKRVLLTRSKENNEILKDRLESLGFKVLTYPMLRQEILDVDLSYIENSIIVITSNFAAKIIAKRSLKNSFVVVGEETSNILKENGHKVIKYFEDSNQLQKYIVNNPNNYLYLRGNIISNDLNYIKDEIIIYNTYYISEISNELIEKIKESEVLTFFSKETAKVFINLLTPNYLNLLNSKEICCFSKNIADEFLNIKLKKLTFSTVAKLDHFIKSISENLN